MFRPVGQFFINKKDPNVFIGNVDSKKNLQIQKENDRKNSKAINLQSFATVRNWFTENLINYCNTTSLHGFNYIAVKGIPKIERYFWIFIVVVSIIVSITLVVVSYFWNRETPTVTVIESSHFPTWEIPFPAVTVCNFNKISRIKAKQLAKTMKRPSKVSDEDILQFFRLSMYFSFAQNTTNVNLDVFEKILEQNNFTMGDLMERLSPDCMDMISKCVWKGINARCDSFFQRIISSEGICCSFNYFGAIKNNFPPKIAYQISKLPYRVTGCGYPTGLSILLDPIIEDYFGTFFSSYGFRLLLHDSYDFPGENSETKVLTSTRESFVRINPESIYATTDIRRMDLSLRGCLFHDERPLIAMRRYSFINCMNECRVRTLFQKCGCVPPNLPNNGSFPICSLGRIDCVMNHKDVFSRAIPDMESTLSLVQDTKVFPCGCLPDCETNHYPSEITMGRLNSGLSVNKKKVKTVKDDKNILLHIFFSDLMSTRYRKEVFQNWLSALASFGGLLGLIMGFSIVTFFEFFYFLTFRPIFNYFNEL